MSDKDKISYFILGYNENEEKWAKTHKLIILACCLSVLVGNFASWKFYLGYIFALSFIMMQVFSLVIVYNKKNRDFGDYFRMFMSILIICLLSSFTFVSIFVE